MTSGDPGGDADFLDHPDVCDWFGDPPRLRSATAVPDIVRALDELDLSRVLAHLPTHPPAAAGTCGLPGSSGDVRPYPARHFTATRAFFREAAHQGVCVVVWTD